MMPYALRSKTEKGMRESPGLTVKLLWLQCGCHGNNCVNMKSGKADG